VRLKATTEILDRAGVRGGMDINLDVEVTDGRSPAQIVQERLLALAEGAARTQRLLDVLGDDSGEQVQDAEVVEESTPGGQDGTEIFTPDGDEEETTATASAISEEELKDL
jgi:hypothetical protein